MVLGIDWMKEVSPICFDFNKMEVTFEKEGKKMTLTGNMETGTCKMIMGKRLHKLLKNKWTQVAQLFSMHAWELEGDTERMESFLLNSMDATHIPWEVTQIDSLNFLLDEFGDLLEEPKALPPPRPIDHTINLKPNV